MVYWLGVLYQADWGQRPVDYLHGMYGLKTAAAERFSSLSTPVRSHLAQPQTHPLGKPGKLVLVSGSNAHYGIRCATVYAETGIYCVNGGTHAGLTIDYILDRARDWLQPGDTVLLPLEFNHYVDRGRPSKFFIHYVLRYDRDYLQTLNPLDQLRFWFGLPLERVWRGCWEKLQGKPEPIETAQAEEVGEFGDRLKNDLSDRNEIQAGYVRDAQPLPMLFDRTVLNYPLPSPFSSVLNVDRKISNLLPATSSPALSSSVPRFNATPGTRSIRRFVRWCRSQNIQVLATFPNALWFEDYQQPQVQDFFQAIRQFYGGLNVPVLGSPEQLMPDDRNLFFDSDYHLNQTGVDQHTQIILQLLRPYQNAPSTFP